MSLQIEEKDVDPKLAEQIEHPHHVPLRIMDSFHREPDFEGWVKGFATKHAVSVFLPNEIRKLTKAILTTEVGESLPAASEQFRYRIVEVGDEAFILGDMEQDNCALPRGSIEAGYSDSETIYRKKVHVAEPGYVLSSKVKRQTMEKGFLCMDTEGDWIDDAKKAESVTDEQFSFYALNKNESSQVTLTSDFKLGNAGPGSYSAEFLPVAEIGGKYVPLDRLENMTAVALKIYHTLRAIHLTCIGSIKQTGLESIWYGR